mmetsp:Transcript_28983/g.63807  ORF Transcript_28983/g.63807 Transcript_28983/m.63807 type:complete len:457 (+) Transcript_28983:202-1572(+)
MAVAVVSHVCSGLGDTVSPQARSQLKNLAVNVHENCLIILDLICQRWVLVTETQTGDSHPAINLDILVRIKRYRGLHRGEHIMALRQHNDMISAGLRQFCRTSSARRPQTSSRGPASEPRGGKGSPEKATVLQACADLLTARTPIERLKISMVRSKLINFMRFEPLLAPLHSAESPWPSRDAYVRFWQDPQPTEGPELRFEPLPPMLPQLGTKTSLPPPPRPGMYTLVLDLDETLVHFQDMEGGGHFGIRPGCDEFLERMHSLGYEIVIFTAATQDYADWVIDSIDPENRIHARLYRQHALPWGPIYVKDLSRLGRSLETTLIIDNVQENFMLQPNNGIFIAPWYDDPHDSALYSLTALLDEIVRYGEMVPEVLDKYRDQIPAWAGFDPFNPAPPMWVMDDAVEYDGGYAEQYSDQEDYDPRPVSGPFAAQPRGVAGPFQAQKPQQDAGARNGRWA